MHLPKSEAIASKLLWLDEAGSTNTECVTRLTTAEGSEWPDFSVIVTDTQIAGKGRLGRQWSAPAGTSLAISVILRPLTPAGRPLPPECLGWMGLLAGLAMTRACTSVLPAGTVASLKWPNDVLIDGRKVCGVLSEMVTTDQGIALVVGTGVNVSIQKDDLPVPTATSLELEGAQVSLDDILASYLQEFSRITRVFVSAAGNIHSSGLRDQVVEACDTIGRTVRVEMPSGETPVGQAVGISETGSLVVKVGECAEPLVVSAGDVTHVRAVDQT